MFDYKLLAALATVAQRHSFDKAAEQLNISQSAISQRIKQLELTLSQPVLIRSQPLQLTPIGKTLVQHFKQVQQLAQDILPTVNSDGVSATLAMSIAVNADSLALWFVDAMTSLMHDFNIEFNIHVVDENRTLDKLRSGEAIAAVSTHQQTVNGFTCSKLGEVSYQLVATPAFIRQYFSRGVNASTVSAAPAVSFDEKDDMHATYLRNYLNIDVSQYRCHYVRSSEAIVKLVAAGVGYALIPTIQIQSELASGQIEPVVQGLPLIETLYWHHWLLVKGNYRLACKHIEQQGRQFLAS